MKKILFILMAVFLIFSASPVYAGPPDVAEGVWKYYIYEEYYKIAGGTTFITTYDYGVLTGTFEGESTEVGTVVIHSNGKASFNALLTFTGEVNGKSGTFKMSVVGRAILGEDWTGQWVILSGTGDLSNLRGEGTWYGPGAGGSFKWGTLYYDGNYHFEPDK